MVAAVIRKIGGRSISWVLQGRGGIVVPAFHGGDVPSGIEMFVLIENRELVPTKNSIIENLKPENQEECERRRE
ncbi:hypothetical protein L2E82_19809 [Cichorium intybus]|uniref:Uncharacterized protein n=1 Tax=Cichorium intybus TaxID=13427 RepID=A0ACB9DSE1_CICIN|nr:hypothetical protein L2E82_19809 [Cichorium intybus]